MKIIGLGKIKAFEKKHADGKSSIQSWRAEAKNSNWSQPSEIKQRYPSADFLADNKVIFNIGGNKYRLAVEILYDYQEILVIWIGPHSKYDKKKF